MIDARPADVLFLIHDLCGGGAERVFVHYVNGLGTPMVAPVLVRPGGALATDLRPDLPLLTLSRPGRAEQVNAAAPRPSRLDRLATRVPAIAAVSLVVKAIRLRGIVRRTGARCVSTFLHKSHLIALLTRDLLAPRLRVVLNVHEVPSQHLIHHFRGVSRFMMRLAYRWAFTRADAVFVVSPGIVEDLVDNYSTPQERIRVVRNPLDLSRIRTLAAEPLGDHAVARSGQETIVGVGRLVALKGFDVLLEALALMDRDGTRVVLVGDGPERERLLGLARCLGIADRVLLVGAQANPWSQLAAANVLALPSRSDAFPNVIGEALALGVPVVAADAAPGIREYLGGGRYGVLVPPEDPVGLARGLERVLDDAELRRTLAERGLERVAPFDLEPTVEAYRRELDEVMGR